MFTRAPHGRPLLYAPDRSMCGLQSEAALATVVGVRIEMPVMLSVVHLVQRTQSWYERGKGAARQV